MTTEKELKNLEEEHKKLKDNRDKELKVKEFRDDIFRMKHPVFTGACRTLSNMFRGIGKGLKGAGKGVIKAGKNYNTNMQKQKPKEEAKKEINTNFSPKQAVEPKITMDDSLVEIASIVQ